MNESLSIKIWWPKDRVVFHRVQQLCQLVVSGEWPAKPEKPERLVDQPVPSGGDLSMSPGGFPMYGESEMDGGLGPDVVVDPVSKAFKVKKVHNGLLSILFRLAACDPVNADCIVKMYSFYFIDLFVARRTESDAKEKPKEKKEG
jgi:hypothetical protein